MSEIKNIFHKGIMNKDLDERLVPNGQFRDAMNVQISTSESSEIGTVQNILGNVRVDGLDLTDFMCVGAIADEKNDVFYWFITGSVDAIIEYSNDGTVTPILVDVPRNVLRFDALNIITGINIIDNLLFWTDNVNEPRKINIDTLKLNNHTDLLTHSDMFVKGISVGAIAEDHITVIRKRPQRAPVILFDNNPYEPITTSIEFNFYDMIASTEFQFNDGPWRYSQMTPTNVPGDAVWPYMVGDEFVLSLDSEPGNLPYNYQIKIEVIGQTLVQNGPGQGLGVWNAGYTTTWTSVVWDLKIIEIDRIYENEILLFNATQIPETDPLFEKELIRFATRWKYVDGEYSAYSPFTVPIFLAGQFYFHPTDDPFNQGMESRATSLTIKDFVREDTPNDVVQIDILFKKERSTTIYSIDSAKIDTTLSGSTHWHDYDNNYDGVHINDTHVVGDPFAGPINSLGIPLRGKSGLYKVTTENIYAALPDNQMLRPWDNVPRKALSQEITANRIIYGNYLQNYSLKDIYGDISTPSITLNSEYRDYLREAQVGNCCSPLPVTFVDNRAEKSIKSLRTYYLGIVYGDKYGRETPVLTSKNASHHIPFDWDDTVGFDGAADDSTRLIANLTGNQPSWARYFKYFIKQTTGEYYNLTLDRVYKAAGDENLWVSFPSSDRNKIEIGDYFSIKKQVDIEEIVPVENKIKIIDIKNEAPESIKFDYVALGSAGGSQVNLDNLFQDVSAQPGAGVKRLLIDKDTWVDDENGLALEDLSKSDRLAIQFTIVESGNNIKSEKYFVTGFSVEDNGGDLQYNIVLRKVIQDADSWVESSIGVLNYNKGLTITIYKLEEKNSVEFEGRFFVKIVSSPVTQTYLIPSTTDIYAFQVLAKLKAFQLFDAHGNWNTTLATFQPGIYNTLNTWGTGNCATYVYGCGGHNTSLSPVQATTRGVSDESAWRQNAAFDTGVSNTGGWFLDNATFVAAQSNNTRNARQSGKMWKGDILSTKAGSAGGPFNLTSAGQLSYINGFEGLISPVLGGAGTVLPPHPNVTSNSWVKSIPYNPPVNGNGIAFANGGGPRLWSETVIDPVNNGQWGNTSGGSSMNPAYDPPPASWDTTYEPVDDGGNWIHLSFLAPGVDLHDGDFSQANDDMKNFSGNENDFHTMLFQALDRIRATTIYRDGIGSSQNDGNWVFPTVGGNSVYFNSLSPEKREDYYQQWEPGYLNPGAQSIVNRLEPGSRFMLANDTTQEIYTIKRVHVKRIYNHTSWNPSPAVFGPTLIHTYDSSMFAKDSNGNGSVSWWMQKMMDYLTSTCVNCYSGTTFNSPTGAWQNFKDAVVRFGKANNRRTTYILQVDKDTTNSLVSWDHDNDPGGSPNIISNFPDTADNNTAQVIRFVDDYIEPGANTLPTSPAIFETEADEDVDLNIYYEASDALPIGLDGDKGHLLAPIGTKVTCSVLNSSIDYNSQNNLHGGNYDLFLKVKSWEGNELELFGPGLVTNPSGQGLATSNDALGWSDQGTIYASHYLWFWREDGSYTSAVIDGVTEISTTGPDFYITKLRIRDNSYEHPVGLSYYNCFSFGNGVESNRVRDDFNESFILNGVKASTVLEEPYEEERRKYGLIYSGIYNSISGINNLNQFIQAEKITKDLMPSYGSIQKLYARDKDLITLCEDKIIRVYVDKDILYNADGNTQLLATNRVLGTAEPFRGNYGISKNPESFAAESFRAYFTDKQRGAVIRLSIDGITPISDAGMHDYFRDNLPLNEVLLGSYDAHKGNYNLTMFKNLYRGDFHSGGSVARLSNAYCTDPLACNYQQPGACCFPDDSGCDNCDGNAPSDCGGRVAVLDNVTQTVVMRLHQHPLDSNNFTSYFSGLTQTQQQIPFQDYWYLRTYTQHQGDCPEDCGYPCGGYGTNTWECSDGACADTGAGIYTEAQCLNQFCGGASSWGCNQNTHQCVDLGAGNGLYNTQFDCELNEPACPGGQASSYPSPADRVLLNEFGREEQTRINSSDSGQYQGSIEANSFSQSNSVEQTCCRVPVFLRSIQFEVTHSIHTNTGMASGSYEWFSWKELMDWKDIQINTWGVATEVIENTILAYSVFNEEVCSCTVTPGCTDPSAYNYNPNATIDDGSCVYQDVIDCMDSRALNYNPNATTACIDCCEYPEYAETVTYNEMAKGWVSFKSFVPELAISSVNQYYTMMEGTLWKHHQETTPETRNTFYTDLVANPFTESSVTPILNKQPDVVKNFNTLNYEGSQTKIDINLVDNDYYNLYEKKGWYVEDIHTDKQDGTLNEFIEKEGKWFNYIKGSCETVDTAAFNFQGLGVTNVVTGECLPCATAPIVGCTDPNADNYNASATVDDGSCTYPSVVQGCTDPTACNYDSTATIDDGSCSYNCVGCMDNTACNYDPIATIDDGSCFYNCLGCTDPTATNYNATAIIDDGSCIYPSAGVCDYTHITPGQLKWDCMGNYGVNCGPCTNNSLTGGQPCTTFSHWDMDVYNLSTAVLNTCTNAQWWQVIDSTGAVVQGGPSTWCNHPCVYCVPGSGGPPPVGAVGSYWVTMAPGTYTVEVYHVASPSLTYDATGTILSKKCRDWTVT